MVRGNVPTFRKSYEKYPTLRTLLGLCEQTIKILRGKSFPKRGEYNRRRRTQLFEDMPVAQPLRHLRIFDEKGGVLCADSPGIMEL